MQHGKKSQTKKRTRALQQALPPRIAHGVLAQSLLDVDPDQGGCDPKGVGQRAGRWKSRDSHFYIRWLAGTLNLSRDQMESLPNIHSA